MKRLFLIITIVCMMLSCGKDPEKATVKIKGVTSVTTNSAKIICEVTDDGGADIIEKGLFWNVSGNPNQDNYSDNGGFVDGGENDGVYECEITGLNANTMYYIKAYAKNSVGSSYSEEHTFLTLVDEGNNGGDDIDTITKPDGVINGFGYVDLGLPSGLKWAAYNIGAETSTDCGDYFAWGEINAREVYSLGLTYNMEIGDISGNEMYDAATANLGEYWRMPTAEEMEELLDCCVWELQTNNECYGYRITGSNGHSIFLPVSGQWGVHGIEGINQMASYWTSTPHDSSNIAAYSLMCYGDNKLVVPGFGRDYGFTIRPVSDGI